MATEIIASENKNQKIDNISILTNGELFNRLQSLSSVMANSGEFVPAHFRGKPDACMAVVMQAARWGLDPFAVAQKTHIVSGTLGYEAQLVNAVINTMAPTKDRLHYEWFGAWENIVGKFVEKTSAKGNKYIAPDWDLKDEAGVGIRVWATLKGEDEPRELTILLSQAQVRNSTLWASDPRQQLAYLATKRWARLYCPDVILGVYTPDERDDEERTEKEVFSGESRINLAGLPAADRTVPPEEETVADHKPGVTSGDLADKFRTSITDAATPAAAQALRSEVEAQKAALGTALYVELKNRSVARYHQLNAVEKLKVAINGLPKPGADGAADAFAAVEKLFTTSKRHLGTELADQYSITLTDMKPEYTA
ncbi:RecT family recombinase [Pantoea sp.]|uniref:RecT family recombinase n=1 Tax=Pantoea sp. TaxID=69393 RepID=UPI0028A80AD0|nr:RecT family recombinase [Pantoea sp.]